MRTYLASSRSDGVSGRRFIATLWPAPEPAGWPPAPLKSGLVRTFEQTDGRIGGSREPTVCFEAVGAD